MKKVKKLPVYKGYTVDARLEEFRKVSWKDGEPGLETIPFVSEKGAKMLEKYINDKS